MPDSWIAAMPDSCLGIAWGTGEVKVRDFNEWFCTFCLSVPTPSARIVGVLIRTTLIMEWQAQKVQDREPEGICELGNDSG